MEGRMNIFHVMSCTYLEVFGAEAFMKTETNKQSKFVEKTKADKGNGEYRYLVELGGGGN